MEEKAKTVAQWAADILKWVLIATGVLAIIEKVLRTLIATMPYYIT